MLPLAGLGCCKLGKTRSWNGGRQYRIHWVAEQYSLLTGDGENGAIQGVLERMGQSIAVPGIMGKYRVQSADYQGLRGANSQCG